ncbi:MULTISPECIES: DUF3341 domain-containing protein [unclassified Microbulbifer]|uniref:DUF3341 domain-containing protein n=1 Tax=unclassified Microbulbifer TaxID=2619833 RepID=UPI0027E56572|nr:MULTISPECIES: DUF3341 domain-containing protein [unclassified Microbulbifer]
MTEQNHSEQNHYGLIARFAGPEALVAATLSAREAGYRRLEAHAPFPVPGLAEALTFREKGIPLIALSLGVTAAAAAFFLQWYTAVIDYPFVVGGKPLNSWPAFLPVTFQVGIFSTVMAATITMLAKDRLPHYYHPIFNCDDFARASADGFFLSVRGGDPAEVEDFLRAQGAEYVRELTL